MPVIRTRLLYAIPLLACLFADAGVSHAQKLRVAYTAFAGTFTILWLGKDAGLYQKHGIDMELLFIGSSTTAVQALLAGDVDVVYSAAAAVIDANLAGAELTMLGCQYDTGQTSFFTTPPVANVAALKGKAVGVSRFGAFSDFVARCAQKESPPANQRCCLTAARRHPGNHRRNAKEFGTRRSHFPAAQSASAQARFSGTAHYVYS
jgi:NitT/TauT family transport system substrate-binding protein